MFDRTLRFFKMVSKIKKWFKRNGFVLFVAILILGLLIFAILV
jgi:predicted negative regulator of RcsB-dependent stress response